MESKQAYTSNTLAHPARSGAAVITVTDTSNTAQFKVDDAVFLRIGYRGEGGLSLGTFMTPAAAREVARHLLNVAAEAESAAKRSEDY